MYVELKTLDIPVCKNPEDTATIDWQKTSGCCDFVWRLFFIFLASHGASIILSRHTETPVSGAGDRFIQGEHEGL